MEANPIPTVAIGGISAKNACELLEGSSTGKLHVDGLAIVSAIMAAEDPKVACEELMDLIRQSFVKIGVKPNDTVEDAIDFAVQAAKNIKMKSPLVHHITSEYNHIYMYAV
jgi:thiamine-phosphate diphosphorylase/hydroxyethylthiazole kinase